MEQESSIQTVQKDYITTSYGKVCYRYVGNKTYPLFLIVHGSGVNSSSADYENMLYEYLVRFSQVWKIFFVSIDCPGYGESTGLRSAIRGYPGKFLKELIKLLTGSDSALFLMGHSQGGYSIFNAMLENPSLSNFIVQDRPVCGDIKRLKDFPVPMFLIYDEEDDGHPIRQGYQIIKMIKNYKFISFKASRMPCWHSDHLFEEILKFLYVYQEYIVNPNDIPDFETIESYNKIKFNNKIAKNVCAKANDKDQGEFKKKTSIVSVDTVTIKPQLDKQNDKKATSNSANANAGQVKPNGNDIQTPAMEAFNETKAPILSTSANVYIEPQNNIIEAPIEVVNVTINSTSCPMICNVTNTVTSRKDQFEQKPARSISVEKQTFPGSILRTNDQLHQKNRKSTSLEKSDSVKIIKEEKEEINLEEPQVTIEKNENDFRCSLCMDLLYKPIILACTHFFCYPCIQISSIYNPCCPLCRKPINNADKIISMINYSRAMEGEMKVKISKDMLDEREKAAMSSMTKDLANTIRIEYGNLSTKLETNSYKPKYKWVFYVKVISSPKKNPIKFVEFDINPHLDGCRPIKIATVPYQIEKYGTYEFGANIKVVFEDSLKLEPYTTSHTITLGPSKTSRQFLVNVK